MREVTKRKVVRRVKKQDNSVASAASMPDTERTQKGSALTRARDLNTLYSETKIAQPTIFRYAGRDVIYPMRCC